ncbi:protein SIEL isoform X2 [Hevea brasiliensis]|uniref:protein SIEL isoform X2 n=1 Tax=Hevea brasiliensis TaxID=3981 RepID=UPI0025CBEBBC|nr:protein SIEL isoform X2 [Hevea brasiliensis]
MEQRVWSSCEQSLDTDKPLSLQALASMRSLIVNPHTSNSTISSILKTLTRSVQQTADSLTRHHTLKLFTDLASYRTHLSPLIFHSLHSNSLVSTDSSLLAAESLAALSSISKCNPTLPIELDDRLFVSLCFGASVSARLWLLRNAEKFGIRLNVLFTVFLGFTKDPYPYVRKEALDGLVGLCKFGVFEDRSVIEGCYYRGVELLKDAEDCVRCAAVRVVKEWGQMLIASSQEEDKRDWSNTVFIQLCSMVRDMCVGVRIEIFNALGNIQMVSEDILLQTLSKKVLSIMKKKRSHSLHTTENFELLASSAAGAFIHGLEDEFCEVQKSACCSLRKLITLSSEFADQALSLLMDMLNANSMVIRLEALETLHHMAISECLNVQEIHMHMDEAGVFSVLFYMGQNHGNFTACIIKEVSQEIEPVSNGDLGLDSARVAAFLVLSISAPLSCDQNGQSIPPRLFSYAVTLLGRITSALNDIVDQNTLLAYLSRCSRSYISSGMEVEGEEFSLPVADVDVATTTVINDSNPVAMPLMQIGNENSEIHSMISCESGNVGTSIIECQLEEHGQIRKSVNLILAQVKDLWLLVQSRCISEALKILRACKEELAIFTPALPESVGALAFTSQYLHVIKLLVKIWGHIVWKVQSCEIGELEILFGKLERRLREMRCRFIGFSKEEESLILELTLLACILRLSEVEICCYLATLKKLSTTISHLEFLNKEGSIELSNFVMEVKKTLHEIATPIGCVSCSPFVFKKLINHYSAKQFSLSRVTHLYAALSVHGNDFENPLPFISGLPVAIPLEITLHNVSRDARLWVRMAMSEELVQFFFLDLKILGGCDEVTKFTHATPFYRTPKAGSFTLRVCVVMECLFEDAHSVKSFVGPKRSLVYLCPEKEVYLYMI